MPSMRIPTFDLAAAGGAAGLADPLTDAFADTGFWGSASSPGTASTSR